MVHRWYFKPRILVFGPLALLLLVALACGDDALPLPTATPQPTATPAPGVDTAALSALVEKAVMSAVPPPAEVVSAAEIQQMVQSAVSAAAPAGATAEDVQRLVEAGVAAVKADAVNKEEVASLVSQAVSDATANLPEPVSASEIEQIVKAAIPATPTPAPTATPAPAIDPKALLVAARYGGNVAFSSFYPELWDPHKGGTSQIATATSPILNNVVQYDANNPSELIGDLAKSWERSDDGKTYTFSLHDNVKWSDGVDLTAEDVAFSLNRMIEPGEPRPKVGLLKNALESAEVVDANTVQLNLKFASASFLGSLAVAHMLIVPKHVLDAGVDISVWENIVSHGPFKPKEITRGLSWTHEKNPDYFKEGRPFFDSLTMFAISDVGTVIAALKTNKIQWTGVGAAPPPQEAVKLREDLRGSHTVYISPVARTQHFFANTEKEPWTDIRVINALRYATDHVEIIDAVGAGTFRVGAPFPVGSWYGSTETELCDYTGYAELPGCSRSKDEDIAAAKALLKEAGFDPPSQLGKREILSCCIFHPDMAEVWVRQMKENLGIEIEHRVVDVGTLISALISGEGFDLVVLGIGLAIDDPDDVVNSLYGPGARNWTRWKNAEFTAMFEKQSREIDRDKRREILREMEDFLLTQGSPYIEAVWDPQYYLASDKLRTETGGFVVPNLITDLMKNEHMWIEQ